MKLGRYGRRWERPQAAEVAMQEEFIRERKDSVLELKRGMFAQETVRLGGCWQTHVLQMLLKILSGTKVGKVKKGVVIRGEVAD